MTWTADLERELRAALSEAHADAPEPSGLADRLVASATSSASPPQGPIARSSRRWLPALVAAAAVLALVVGAGLVVSLLRDDDGARPATEEPWLTTPLVAPESLLDVRELGFHVAPVGGVQVSNSWGLDSDGQQTDVTVDGHSAVVEVHYQGRSLRPLAGTSEDVTVHGLPGTYTEAVSSNGYTARLSWRYAPDSWAEVGISGDGEPAPDLRQHYLKVAEAVRPGGDTLRLPVRFGVVPAPLPSIARAHQVVVNWNEGDWTMWLWVDDVFISATSAVDLGECLGDNGERQTAEFTYRGQRGCVVPNGDQERVGLHLGGTDVTYDFDPSAELPLEDIKRLLGDMKVTKNRFDVASGFDLETALGR